MVALVVSVTSVTAQQVDSVKVIELGAVEVVDEHVRGGVERLPEVHGTLIMAGKKNEVLRLRGNTADLSTNAARQVFAKAPGISVWESEGSGIQVSVAARGLSPNRSMEFNVRQNGYDICAEAFGYPEAYYSPPMEAVDRIELVRGAAALQFGPQFGGLLNYRLKRAVPGRKLAFEMRQTAGSYGLHNSFLSFGGSTGRWGYYAFHQRRSADGWRDNSRYSVGCTGASVSYAATRRLQLGLEYTRMDYSSQQPGGMTDANFGSDARSSTRSRNWFSAPWNVAALTADMRINERAQATLKVFGTLAERNSVGFLRPINEPDTFITSLGSFASRQVDRDAYTNAGAELRFLQGFGQGRVRGNLSAGARIYRGRTDRRQQGKGSVDSDADYDVSAPYGRELVLSTDNAAFFAEQQIRIGERFSIVPGVRLELIGSSVEGRISAAPEGTIEPEQRQRHVLLYGLSTELRITKATSAYGSYSTAYRPVLFSELTPSATTDQIDAALKDASGSNIDLGYRGRFGRWFAFDLSAFHLLYDNRIGTVTREGAAYRTNIGTSVSKGVEAYAEVDLMGLLGAWERYGSLTAFASVCYMDARYTRWDNPAIASDQARSIEGKRVEYAPERVERYGLTWVRKGITVNALLSRMGEVFTDAANTEAPNAAATIGRIDGYAVLDLSASCAFGERFEVTVGLNNATDERYTTRRSGGYPGPGLLPANGRTVFLTLGARL